MFAKIMDAMFGCRHSRYTFPMTIRAGLRRAAVTARTGTYVVCLDCGREFAYDWKEMRVGGSPPKEAGRALVTKIAS